MTKRTVLGIKSSDIFKHGDQVRVEKHDIVLMIERPDGTLAAQAWMINPCTKQREMDVLILDTAEAHGWDTSAGHYGAVTNEYSMPFVGERARTVNEGSLNDMNPPIERRSVSDVCAESAPYDQTILEHIDIEQSYGMIEISGDMLQVIQSAAQKRGMPAAEWVRRAFKLALLAQDASESPHRRLVLEQNDILCAYSAVELVF